MAIARTAASDFNPGGSGTSQTKSFDCSGGNFLLVFAWKQQNFNASDTCTYNGTSMTYIGQCNEGTSTGALQVYYLKSPSSGANNIVFTLNSGSAYIRMIAVAYSGTNTTTQPDGSNFANKNNASGTITVTTANSWVVSVFVDRDTLASATGTGVLNSTNIVKDTDIQLGLWDSNTGVSAGASQSYGVTGNSTAQPYYICAISVAPAGAAPSVNSQFLMFM